jgi:KUP system potassium uptake protein
MQNTKTSLAALTVGAFGVVYGDIGTSVLYAIKEVFGSGHVPFTPENVYGVLSIFFWTITVIVSLKYVALVLRADNNGEGGLVAMLALASQAVKDKPKLRSFLLLVGIFGTCLFYGDGVITPAISVLSAVEGLEVVSPKFKDWVIPLTIAILFALFAVQKRGTAGIGRFFGPITLAWFLSLAVLGVSHIVHHPGILTALSPHHALRFMFAQPGTTFIILGAVVLCVTGAEALYADLGHFGKKPIRLAWFSVVMPSLTLNYFGQGALLLARPEAVKNPFYMMAPEWATLPLVGLATAATVIASQALITGAFSVTKQVIQLGYLPRLQIRHTSVRDTGQIYIPAVNWGLFVGVVLAVVLFRSSSNLAAAYGIAVTLDMLITTVLTFFVIRYGWGYPLALCVAATGFFFVVDLAFFSSNLLKFAQGGWFPLAIGAAIFTLMTTWKSGRAILHQQAARAVPRARALSRSRLRLAADPRGRDGRLPDRGAGRRPQRPASQFKAQQGAAREERLRHGPLARGALDRARQARGGHAFGQRLLASRAALRIQERSERAQGAGASERSRMRPRPHGHELLSVPRSRGAHHRRRHGALARKAVCADASQRERSSGLPRPSQQRGGGTRLEDRDMNSESIQPGSIVEARRGGPPMEVRSVSGNWAVCSWFDADGKRHVDRFQLIALVLLSAAPLRPNSPS